MLNEQRLISAIVREKDIAPVISVSNIDQLFETHSDVWKYVLDYYYKHRAIVPEDILNEVFINEGFKVEETTGTVKHYLDQLRSEYQTVKLDQVIRGASASFGKVPNEDILARLQQRVLEINSASANIRDLDITDGTQAMEHYDDMKRKMEANGGVLGIRTGFDSIDANYSTGMAPGHVMAILSRTGQGKSWLALDIAINAWAQGKKVLFVSLEMTPESVRDRAYTLMSKGLFGMSDLSRAQIDLVNLKEWSDEKFKSDGSFIATASDGMGDFSVGHLQSKIDIYGPDLVVVDYLQLLQDSKNSSGESDRVRNASKDLKRSALSNNIPILVIAAASSYDTKEYDSPPLIKECAGSKQAVFDLDVVLSVFSRKQMDGVLQTEIICRKNRWGPDFNFVIHMDIANGKITEQWDSDIEEF